MTLNFSCCPKNDHLRAKNRLCAYTSAIRWLTFLFIWLCLRDLHKHQKCYLQNHLFESTSLFSNLYITKDGYGYLTNNPDEACLFVVSYHPESKLNLQDLPYWKGDGRNHVIIDTSLVQTSPDKKIQEISSEKHFVLDNIGKAMIVSADYFVKNNQTPRLGFDILVPKFRYNIVYGFCQKQTKYK